MKVSLRAVTVELDENGELPKDIYEVFSNTAIADRLEIIGGHAANMCYTKKNAGEIYREDAADTLKRINQTKSSGHHSVYDHSRISLEIAGLPKALAMVLNNEHDYSTSEKSARYTKMVLQENERALYNKWLSRFIDVIGTRYSADPSGLFTEEKIEKLAQENARYLTSVYTPTNMLYSASQRQFNYLYKFLQSEINRGESNRFYEGLKPAMSDFCKSLENLGIIKDKLLQDGKGRSLSLIRTAGYPQERVFTGDTYATTYKGSLAQFAQAHRHRTIDYSFALLDNNEYYVPPILDRHPELIREWLSDCEAQSSVIPQGTMVQFYETGTLNNFVLKMCERKCTFAQLEINRQTDATLREYVATLEAKGHPAAKELGQWEGGSRCSAPKQSEFGLPVFGGCATPCKFKDGINGEREI